MEREAGVFKFNEKSLTEGAAATLKFNARPGAIAAANHQ